MPAHDTVLFCPFCGDGFEGLTQCPDHELALVPWQELPKAKRSDPPELDLAWHSPRLGRAWLALSSLFMLGGFASLPLGRVTGASGSMGGSMLQLALHGAHKLWLVPAASAVLLALLYRRRSPRAMRAARVAAAFTAMVPSFALVWAWSSTLEAVALLAERSGEVLVPELASGAYTILLATIPGLIGALRFGGSGRDF
jgi:hypothetical protein